jgi:hypothetical protein
MRFAFTALLTAGTVVWQASAFASATFPAECTRTTIPSP